MLRTRKTLAAAVACAAACLMPAAASAQDVAVYDATFDGKAEVTRTSDDVDVSGHYHRDTAFSFSFRSVATDLEFVDGLAQRAAGVSQMTTSGFRHSDTGYLTSPDHTSTGKCVAGAWDADTSGVLVVTDLRGPKGGLLGRFTPFTSFGGPQTCSGMMGGISSWGSYSTQSIQAEFDFPRESVGAPKVVVPVKGVVACPEGASFVVACQAKWSGTITFLRTATGRDDEQPPAGPGPGQQPKPPVDEGPIPEEEQQRIAKSIMAVFLRENGKGRVKTKCTRACTGKISAYAVALRKQRGKGGGKGKPRAFSAAAKAPKAKLVGKATFRSKQGGAVTKTLRFGKAARKAIRRAGAVRFKVTVKPVGGGEVVSRTITVKARG